MTSLRTMTRVMLTASVLAMGFTLAGCEDPKLLAMFDGKKKLPGERKEVFPGGTVPGIQTGVPPELMKGYKPPLEENPQANALSAPEGAAPAPEAAPPQRQAAAAAPAAETGKSGILVGNAASGVQEPPKPKRAAKPKPKPQPVAAAPQPVQREELASPPPQQAPAWPAQQQRQAPAQPAGTRPWPGQ